MLSYQFVSDFLQLLLDFLRVSIEMFSDFYLFLVGELVKDLAKLSVHHCLAGRVIRPETLMISASKSGNQVFHVEFKVSEEINIFTGLKRTKGIDSSIDGRVNKNL